MALSSGQSGLLYNVANEFQESRILPSLLWAGPGTGTVSLLSHSINQSRSKASPDLKTGEIDSTSCWEEQPIFTGKRGIVSDHV